MFLADIHTHSVNSPDGESPVDAMCRSAIEKKLDCIAVTDHCEIDLYKKDRCEELLGSSWHDTEAAQGTFEGKLEILKGVELGNALYDTALAWKTVKRRPYDLVLGSLHHPTGVEDFAFIDFNKTDVSPLMDLYFDELEQLVDWGRFDVLTHITYPLRYINGIFHMNVDIRRYERRLRAVYKKLIENGKGLEINTSGLRQPYGVTMPDLWCLKLYRDEGGTVVTVGSDAHTAADVGANIADGLKLAKEAGFAQYTFYRQRKPVSVKIDV